MNYIINEKTLFIMKKDDVIEVCDYDGNFQYQYSINKLLEESCLNNGSSYLGRLKATKYLTNIKSKIPIMLSEKNKLIIFPLFSPRNNNGLWLVFNNILKYRKVNKYTEITFKNNQSYIFLVSFNIVNNQILKCSQLLTNFYLK